MLFQSGQSYGHGHVHKTGPESRRCAISLEALRDRKHQGSATENFPSDGSRYFTYPSFTRPQCFCPRYMEPDTHIGGTVAGNPDDSLSNPAICVICLDVISDQAISRPCYHNQFDFICLATWLQENRTCPLCKTTIENVRYVNTATGATEIHEPAAQPKGSLHGGPRSPRERHQQHLSRHSTIRARRTQSQRSKDEIGVEFRRQVYRLRMYSMYVGSNRISGYRNLEPLSFAEDERLVSRARKWIRRELQVFDFLNPDSASFGSENCRATNSQFLLEYTVAILKAIDLRGSAGQAEELMTEFLGRENTRIFVHELLSWLRSPFERLEDWDRNVQYSRPADDHEIC